ncbi:hypothetical protein G443_003177 [Actinoalloteichus cyanogriseus DSM 43889]|uniref:Uncharacterized protein n=1 Tax=Actinoalloteichus caeruleus DSM 43889 TaxID=1120930 RepID=A0ABT1JK71_ACTCY|nr:hypothetical protein [Actinoalloteichus caeruleus DSM 43889]
MERPAPPGGGWRSGTGDPAAVDRGVRRPARASADLGVLLGREAGSWWPAVNSGTRVGSVVRFRSTSAGRGRRVDGSRGRRVVHSATHVHRGPGGGGTARPRSPRLATGLPPREGGGMRGARSPHAVPPPRVPDDGLADPAVHGGLSPLVAEFPVRERRNPNSPTPPEWPHRGVVLASEVSCRSSLRRAWVPWRGAPVRRVWCGAVDVPPGPESAGEEEPRLAGPGGSTHEAGRWLGKASCASLDLERVGHTLVPARGPGRRGAVAGAGGAGGGAGPPLCGAAAVVGPGRAPGARRTRRPACPLLSAAASAANRRGGSPRR